MSFRYQLFLFFALASCNSRESNLSKELEPQKVKAVDTTAVIAKIKSGFNQINSNLNSYSVQSYDIYGMSSEGGKTTSYYDQKELKKIQVVFFGEMGKSELEYYFDLGKLIFVYEKKSLYNKPIYLESSKVSGVKENRFYIYEKSLIRWLNGEDIVSDVQQKRVKYSEIMDGLSGLKKEIKIK